MNTYFILLMIFLTLFMIGGTDMYNQGVFENDISCSKEDVNSCKHGKDCNCVHNQKSENELLEEIIVPVEEPVMCIQVITYAKDPLTNETKQFPNPCVIPDDWEIVDAMEN